jgi:catechol 2,3-dioxygenase-like lactoylglutathione lyase family enzyme
MLVEKLAFVMLGSNDLDRATKFYVDVLGLRASRRFGDFVFFETGETTLALSGELGRANLGGGNHECVFAVASVTQAHAALKNRIAFLNEPRRINENSWAVNFLDPDRHLLSLYGPR